MLVVVTGASSGIGEAVAVKFLYEGYDVVGVDIAPSATGVGAHSGYMHKVWDIATWMDPPEGIQPDILITCAGVQSEDAALAANLEGIIRTCEVFALDNPRISSVVNVVSASATTGAETPYYVASKGGALAYTRWLAKELAPRAVVNSVSPGGVGTPMTENITRNFAKYERCKSETLLHKWATADEVAELIYFLAAINRSITAQDIVIDNGEMFNHIYID